MDISTFLSSITLPSLTDEQSLSLLSPFTSDELLSTIKALPLRKAPGPDGIPYEWYQTFAEPLIPILLPLFNAVLSGRSPPPSWSQTLVCLLPKPGRVHSDLANWQPITLANCDVKIFSRMLASRLAVVLPDLVSPHQAGFVRGRNAADVAMALRNVLGHAAEAATPRRGFSHPPVDGALVFLDQEKAYDRISHPYLRAVLNKFGFPILVQHAFAATYTNTSAFFLDDGYPVGPVPVACGVRQGDPLAPLLFNLAFEPLLVALRKRLRGLRLPWGVYITGAYADDLGIGVALSDGRILIVTLEDYCRASNSRINFHKSVYMPLSPTATTLPPWAASLGLQFHNPRIPIRVLGYDLVLSPDGVQEDWDALYAKLESTSRNILSRHLTLQGRSLLVTSKLFSRLWYKFRLSSPDQDGMRRFLNLGWSTIWNDHTALKPSMPIGRRSRLTGGVNFLSPWVQAQALQAQWVSTFFTRSTVWSDAFQWAMNQQPGGTTLLASTMRRTLIVKFPTRWQAILSAWAKLRPHWNPDLTVWSVPQALQYRLTSSSSARNPEGVPLRLVIDLDPTTQRFVLISDDVATDRFSGQAPVRVVSALQRVRDHPTSFEAQLVQLLCSQLHPFPYPARFRTLFDLLLTADLPVRELTTARSRHYIDSLDKISTALDWNKRAISRISVPPPDIWRRLWRGPLLPRHRETWYKLIMNALPLGTRIFQFAPEALLCHACSTPQTLQHFVHTCPLAQQVWSDFRAVFSLSHPVSLRQALYSWPAGGSRFLGREFGYRLQAGHAVALHTLWITHCEAVYDDTPSSRTGISNRFHFFLRRHFRSLASSRFASRLGTLPPFFSS